MAKPSDNEITHAYEAANLNQVQAAKKLGIGRSTLRHHLKRIYGDNFPRNDKGHAIREKFKDPPEVEIPPLPSPEEDPDVTWGRMERVFDRNHKAERARDLVPIRIKTDKPIVIHIFGDLHLGNSGTNHHLLRRHSEIVAEHPQVFGIGIGDHTDNWFGKLAHKWSTMEITEDQELNLFKHWLDMVESKLLALVDGNHDIWPTPNSGAIRELLRGTKLLSGPWVRIRFILDNKQDFIFSCHHKGKGSSVVNDAHAAMTLAQRYWQDSDVVAVGHRHKSGLGGVYQPTFNKMSWGIQIGSYKQVDDYAARGAFRPSMSCPSVSILLNPSGGAHDRVVPFWSLDRAVANL